MIKEYIAYLKDNPEGHWFKPKLYGWGWTPATWQGWIIIALYIVSVVAFALTINEGSTVREIVFTFVLPVFFLTVLLVRICYVTGGKTRWQWGPKNKK